MAFIFSSSHKEFSLVLLQVPNYISNPRKMQKIMQYSLNYSGIRLLSTEIKILNFLVDSVLIFCILYVSQETLVCYHNPCHHGGNCVENPLAPCVCPNGYIGPHCEGNMLGQILLWSNTKHPRVNKILYPIHLCVLTGTYTYKTVESRLSGFVWTWANSPDKGKYETS